jgi:hypothetical protein
MNMMSVLLGATGLLLVAALILSFGSMNRDVKDEPSQQEIAALRSEVEVLRAAEGELRLLRHQKSSSTAILSNPSASNIAEANSQAALAAENAILKDELEAAKTEAAVQADQVAIYKDEVEVVTQHQVEANDRSQRQARIIKEALLIATVTEWSPGDGFAVLSVQRHESAQEGTVLAIRRNTGIIGQLKISSLYNDGAVADPIPGTFLGGSLDIKPGDQLIIPPL